MKFRGLKIAITGVALTAIAAHLIWPDLKIDALTLGLLVLAALPWLIPMVKSAEFPGGWKIEFQDIRDAVRSADEIRAESSSSDKPGSLSYLDVFDQDPNVGKV